MIYFDLVSKIYPNAKALDEVSFTVEPGEFVSIVGHSGAGKSTILKMILAEDIPSAGQVFFDSLDIHNVSKKDIGGSVILDIHRRYSHTSRCNEIPWSIFCPVSFF